MFKTIEGVQVFDTAENDDASEGFDQWKEDNENDNSMFYLNIKGKRKGDIKLHMAKCSHYHRNDTAETAISPKACAHGQGKLREFIELNELPQPVTCRTCKPYW